MHFSDRRRLLLCGAMLASWATAPMAFAESNTLQEVVVTARRVEENVQSVPITIQAFSAESLRENSVTETRDLMFSVPGVYMGGTGSMDNTQYVIRAQGNTGPQERSIPGVASYFADVPLPLGAQSQPGYDLGSVQVLKGPQGTLFGRNTVGGAILVYPAAPTFDGFNGYVQGSVGDYNLREGEVAINAPIVKDVLAGRLSFHAAKRDGFTKNLTPGEPDGAALDNWGVRAQLLWTPTSSISNRTIYDFYRSSTGNSQPIILDRVTGKPVPPTFVGLGTVGTGDWHTSDTGVGTPGSHPRSYVKQYGVTNRTDIDMGQVQFTNIAAYRNSLVDSLANNDGVDFLFQEPNQGTHLEQFTEEAQLKGKFMGDRVEWLLGGFYLKSKPLKGSFSISYGFPPLFGQAINSYTFQTDNSRAIYGNVTVHLDELLKGLDANFGYRYTWDKTSLCSAVANPASAFNAPPYPLSPGQCNAAAPAGSAPGLDFAGASKLSSSAPTWNVGLNWQATDNDFFYVTSRRGYRAGGLNSPTFGGPLAAFQTFKPEKVTDLEVGARTDWTIGTWRARFNVSAFRSVTKNVQLGSLFVSTGAYNTASLLLPALLGPPPAGYPAWIPCIVAAPPVGTGTTFDRDCNPSNDPTQTIVTYNGDKRITRGLELEAILSPMENLTLSWSGTFYDHTFTPGTIPGLFAPYGVLLGQTAASDPGQSLGTRTSMTAGVRYVLPLNSNWGQVVFNADAYFSDKLNVGGVYLQPNFHVVNLRLDWNNVAGRPVDASIFVRNAFDKNYAIGSGAFVGSPFGLPNAVAVLPGDPRMIGAQLRYRFGG